MGALWKLEESRLVQSRNISSAANAEILGFGSYPVPLGKIWVVLGFAYAPSVAETQTISFYKTNGVISFGLLNPISVALNPHLATFIEQGMEYTLYPGEYIICLRGGHTAGSTMAAYMQFVEIDQPLYTYEEPQLVKRQQRALSSIRTALGGGMGGRGGGGTPPGGPGVTHGGGGGTGIPV